MFLFHVDWKFYESLAPFFIAPFHIIKLYGPFCLLAASKIQRLMQLFFSKSFHKSHGITLRTKHEVNENLYNNIIQRIPREVRKLHEDCSIHRLFPHKIRQYTDPKSRVLL